MNYFVVVSFDYVSVPAKGFQLNFHLCFCKIVNDPIWSCPIQTVLTLKNRLLLSFELII